MQSTRRDRGGGQPAAREDEMRHVVMLAAVLGGLLAAAAPVSAQTTTTPQADQPAGAQATPRPDEMVNNPAFSHWAGFKRGTTVTQKQTVTLSDGRKIVHDITVRLAEKTRDKVVIETTMSPTMIGMVSSTRTFTTFPAKVKMERVQTPRSTVDGFSEGEEDMTVRGQKVTAHWVEAVTKAGDEVTTRKVWSAREMPGGVIRETIVRKKGDQMLSDSVMETVGIKVP